MTMHTQQQGFSIMEIVVAVSIFLVLGAGVTFLATGSFAPFTGGGDVVKKERFAQDAVEALQIIQQRSWTLIDQYDTGDPDTESNSVRLDKNADGDWTISSGTETRDGMTRYVYISTVQRDGSGEIVASSGTDDPATKRVVVVVRSTGYADYELETYLSNTDAYRISQTSWSGATSTDLWSSDAWTNWEEQVNMDVPSSSGRLDLASTTM